MKNIIVMLAAMAVLFLLPSCEKVKGEGPLQTETRAETGFSGVSVNIPGKINYTIAPVYKVEITAQRNILDVIETYQEHGYLKVKVRNGVSLREHEDIVVNISAPHAGYLSMSGSAAMNVTGTLNEVNMEMHVSGSGSIEVADVAVTGKLYGNISGSGRILVAAGTVKDEELRISGSGKIVMDGAAGEKGICTISGSGDMYVKLSQSLDATISGSGNIYYRGTPQVTSHISGSGKVKPL